MGKAQETSNAKFNDSLCVLLIYLEEQKYTREYNGGI
jgi:hypothetical protein